MTNRTSTRLARVIICPKVIDMCRSSMRQHGAGSVPSRRMPLRVHAFPIRVLISLFSIASLALSRWPFSAIELWAQAPQGRAVSRLEGTVDPAIRPGDDFFAYANGAWLKAAVI